MKVTRIAIFAVAVGAAGIAALLAMNLSEPSTIIVEKEREASRDTTTTQILVASRTIPLGEKIRPAAMTWQKWPKGSVSDAYITKASDPNAIEDYTEAVATTKFTAGEPLVASDLARSGDGFMSAILPKGSRAVSIKVASASRAAGFILPNDRIDVILTRSVSRGGSRSNQHISQTILSNTRVLAIDQTYEERDGVKYVTGDIATLELSPSEAEIIALADQMGKLSLSLRSVADIGENIKNNSDEIVKSLLGNGARGGGLNIIRYGMANGVN